MNPIAMHCNDPHIPECNVKATKECCCNSHTIPAVCWISWVANLFIWNLNKIGLTAKRLKPIEWVDETSWMKSKVTWISELEIISSVFYFTGFKYLIIRKGCFYLTLWKYTWCHFKFGKLCCSQLSRVRPEQLAVKLPKVTRSSSQPEICHCKEK